MRIQLKLYGTLRRLSPGGKAGAPLELDLPDGATIQELIDLLEIPDEETKVSFVNNLVRDKDYRLEDGDKVGIFPPVGGGACDSNKVEVLLYGQLASYGGKEKQYGHAHLFLDLPSGSTVKDLLALLKMPTEARGVTIINSQLSAMPGLQPDLDIKLNPGDRIAFFHPLSMWPYQYRSGIPMTPELTFAMHANQDKGVHHSYAKE
jgi:sulfur-carrier protein